MQALIENLSSELNQKLLRLGGKRNFSANQQIFAENERATFLPIILKGSIKMVRFPALGKEVIIGVFRAGEIFAIPPALDGKPFPATAIAMEETELLLLPRPKFLDLMDESNEFSSLVLSKMCGILRDRSKTVQILATPSAEQRIGAVLLQLAEDELETAPVEIKLRRQDIAEMAGLTTETAIRAIGLLADKNLLKIIRRKIVVEDIIALRNFLK